MERQQELKWLPQGCDLYGKKEGEILTLSESLFHRSKKGIIFWQPAGCILVIFIV